MNVRLVSLREALLDQRVRQGRVSPTSRVDLMRDLLGRAYDGGLFCKQVAERWAADEPRFDLLVEDPNTRQDFAIVNVPYETAQTFLRVLVEEGKGGQTAIWEQVRRQMAAECGLN